MHSLSLLLHITVICCYFFTALGECTDIQSPCIIIIIIIITIIIIISLDLLFGLKYAQQKPWNNEISQDTPSARPVFRADGMCKSSLLSEKTV